MSLLEDLVKRITKLAEDVHRLETQDKPRWIYLQAPLTSASWDDDTYSDTAKTVIDLSAVFGVPAGVKAILAVIRIADIDSTGPDDNFLILSPTNVADQGPRVSSKGHYDNDWVYGELTVPCDANGDVYYQTAASGILSLRVNIQIWGFYI